jgi:hypothetical protein
VSGGGGISLKGITRKVSWIYFSVFVQYWFVLNWDKAFTNCIVLFCSETRQTERQSLHCECIACFLNVILRNGIQIRLLVCDVRKLPAADWPDPSWQSIDGCRSASSPHPSSAVLLCLLSHLDARLTVFLSLTPGSLSAAWPVNFGTEGKQNVSCFILWT